MSQGGYIICGLDIGTHNIKVVIAQLFAGEEVPRIIGVATSPSLGMRKGAVVDIEDVVSAIRKAIEEAEMMAGVSVKNVLVSMGSSEISSQDSKGVVAVGKVDGEVIQDDIDRALSAAKALSLPANKEILHVMPKGYKLDEQSRVKDPLGMHGVRLELEALVIEGFMPHVKNISRCLDMSGLVPDEIVLDALASARSVLNKKQKELGSVVIDIGGGKTSMAVYEEGDLIHVAIIPVGAGHITNDLAIGLRTSVDVAEKVKTEFATAFSDGIEKNEEIDLSQIDSQEEGRVYRCHVAEIVEARLDEIFNLVNKELASIERMGMLPAGAILTGGGAKMPQIVDKGKKILGLPVKMGYPAKMGGLLDKVDDPSFATTVGLLLWSQDELGPRKGPRIGEFFKNGTGSTVGKVKGLFEKFLP